MSGRVEGRFGWGARAGLRSGGMRDGIYSDRLVGGRGGGARREGHEMGLKLLGPSSVGWAQDVRGG